MPENPNKKSTMHELRQLLERADQIKADARRLIREHEKIEKRLHELRAKKKRSDRETSD